MDFRKLHSFVRIVDIGSLTRAATILHVAQPALSQQIATLEGQFGRQLLVRSKQGVVPTEAGRILYKHAQLMLRQVEQAQAEIQSEGGSLTGRVSVGLAPFSSASVLALPLILAVRERHPAITLHINENLGGIISEAVMTGKLDLAFIYDPGPIRGVEFEPVLTEDLYLVSSGSEGADGPLPGAITLAEVAVLDLLLPPAVHTVRQAVDTAFRRSGYEPRIVAEIESIQTMTSVLAAGFGATILPFSAAETVAAGGRATARRITKPSLQTRLSLCTSDHRALTEPAQAVRAILVDLVKSFAADHLEPAPDRGTRRANLG